MSNFLALIQNENMKIYRKNATKIMLAILIGLILAAGCVIKFNEPAAKANPHWKQSLIEQNQTLKKELKKEKGDKSVRDHLKQTIAVNQYRVDHNIKPAQGETLWGFVEDVANNLEMVIVIFTIIVVSTSIAGEFDSGTIKLLMIRPIYRTVILLSKYAAALLFAIACLVILFAASWLTGGTLFGFGGAAEPHLAYINGAVSETSWTWYILKMYLFDGVQLVMMVTLAGVIAAVFRNGALAIGLSIGLTMGASIIVTLLSGYAWVKYVLFANMDLTQYISGKPLRSDMTLGFSITVLCIYYVLFVLLGWLFFTKRDIAA